MVESTLRHVDPNVPVRTVNASRGKVTRAEPVSALYEQGRVSHVGGFPELEDQMCAFTSDFNRNTAGYSPDRVDALVWALTSLSGPEPTFTFAGEKNYTTSRTNLNEQSVDAMLRAAMEQGGS
jgi:phage terminase large subunit-like protein